MARLAWFSPMPPARTGVAACSADFVSPLRAHHDIDVFVDEPLVQRAAGAVSAHEFLWRHRQAPYDATIYQVGNSSSHDYLWPYLFRFPGIAVLHDVRLHHARAASLLRRGCVDHYRQEFSVESSGRQRGSRRTGGRRLRHGTVLLVADDDAHRTDVTSGRRAHARRQGRARVRGPGGHRRRHPAQSRRRVVGGREAGCPHACAKPAVHSAGCVRVRMFRRPDGGQAHSASPERICRDTELRTHGAAPARRRAPERHRSARRDSPSRSGAANDPHGLPRLGGHADRLHRGQ